MRIRNVHLASRRLATSDGKVEFDQDGVAEVSDETGGLLIELPHYECADEPDLGSMNVPQLRKYARDNDIDLGDATKKADILSAIQSD